MPVDKIIFLQKGKINFNNLQVASFISHRLKKKLILFLIEIPENQKEKAKDQLFSLDIDFEIRNQIEYGEAKDEIKSEKPDLLIMTREKISPFEHIFKLTSSEKFIKGFEYINILLLQEDCKKIEKILINIDRDTSTLYYIKSAFSFAKKLGVDFQMITSFCEIFYENRLKKTHPDEEAKKLVSDIFKEHIDAVKRKIAESIGGENVELIVVKGDPKKEIPYYARKNLYDLLIINEDIEEKDSYIENSEMSVGIFKDEEGA